MPPSETVPREERAPDPCARCAHYFVTWDPRRPHGCRAMGFKAARRPWLVVLECSGSECRARRERPAPRETVPARR